MQRAAYDFAVIGGGILGLSHAAAAAAAGLRTIVVEREARGASSASVRNFGLLTQLYDAPGPWGARARRSRELYAAWAAAEPSLPLTRVGSLQLAQTPLQSELLRAYAAAAPAAGYRAALVTREEAEALAPALAGAAAAPRGGGAPICALHFPDDALLEPRLMFARGAGLPALLERAGVAFAWGSPCVALRGGGNGESGSGGVELTLADGSRVTAARAALCAGADVASLLPQALAWERRHLRLCKLQMLRLRLPAGSGGGGGGGGGAAGAPQPVLTSGLSLRRYPGPAALCPAAHGAMMEGDAPACEAAEALGVHIIARPAPALPRTAFGGLAAAARGGGGGGGGPLDFGSSSEWVVGDSHEYRGVDPTGGGASLGGPAGDTPLDEVCHESVTDAILREAAGMLRGVGALAEWRGGGGGGGAPRAALLAQWSGTYLEHAAGLLQLHAAVGAGGEPRRLPEEAFGDANVHVVTGIGGKGMTMGPAVGAENVARWFAQ